MSVPEASIPSPAALPVWRRALQALIRWFDTGPLVIPADGAALATIPDRVEWTRILPFIGMHLACLAVIWVGWSPIAVLVAVLGYFVRMLAITARVRRRARRRGQ